jgi:flagellin-like hook-associated protein FlgL
MTIPPIGNIPGSLPGPDEKITEGNKPEKARQDKEVRQVPENPREKVEISSDAARIRERQAEITQLQVAERAARAMDDVEQRARETVRNANRNNDRTRSEEIAREIDKYAEEMRKAAESAKYNNENLLDGREMNFKVEGREYTLQTVDADKYAQEFVDRMHAASESRARAEKTETPTRTREFADEAASIRKRLERDVRESIAGAMKESSAAQVRDVADAEKLIRDARASTRNSENHRTTKPASMEGNAVDLLQ